MKRNTNLMTAGPALIVLGLCLAVAPGLQAQVTSDSDVSSTYSVPDPVSLGQPITVTTSYANAGPDTATSMYLNSYFMNTGGQELMDEVIAQEGPLFEALNSSAAGTDTNGNAPFVFNDDFYCMYFYFQNQGDNGEPEAVPMAPLGAGEDGSFTYQTTIPMDMPNTSAVEIISPPSLAKTWTMSNAATIMTNDITRLAGYTSSTCEKLVGTEEEDICHYIDDNCWGARINDLAEPIEADFELVDDGSADPTFGCDEFVDFTPGNIAVLRRGSCEFGVKGFNAEQAGATAVFMVNHTGCVDGSTSENCAINMGAGVLGDLVSIPITQVSFADGEPVIAALEDGATVRGIYGGSSTFKAQGYILLNSDNENDPDPSNDYEAAIVSVSATPSPPVAGFTFSPAAPTTGSAVQFTDTSTGGAPDTWAWDFGDGGTSTDQNPSYVFSSADTFTVSLMVTNAGGSDSTTMDVTVILGEAFAESYYIPAAALASGAEGSFFQTDVDVNNSGATDAGFAFAWLPRGANNSDPTQSETITLAAGASMRFENVLSGVFGLEPNVSGALAVLSNSADMKIGSRTYNVPTAKASGTFGQYLPGVAAAGLIAQNEIKRIIFMSENDDLRANVGCVNGMNDNVPIQITTYDDEGAMLETQTMSLAPWSNNQINRIFEDFAPTNGYVDVTSIKVGAGYYCYGSVLDNGSNDPTSILPTVYGSTNSYFIPAAALASGAEGSFFQTDVDINNSGAEMATYSFWWLPRGANNSAPAISDEFTLAAGAGVRYENVLSEVFGLEPNVSGALAVAADSADLGVMTRTYNVPTTKVAGTFGQAIPGIPGANLVRQNEVGRIIFMSENDDLRANFGCVNGVNDNLPITITLYDEAGAVLGTDNMNLGPWSNNQINQIFDDYAPTNGYVDFTSVKATAEYYCYGSVLDNGSNDPTTILPQ